MGIRDLSQAEEPSLKNGIFYIFIEPFLARNLCCYPSTANWVVYAEQQHARAFFWMLLL